MTTWLRLGPGTLLPLPPTPPGLGRALLAAQAEFGGTELTLEGPGGLKAQWVSWDWCADCKRSRESVGPPPPHNPFGDMTLERQWTGERQDQWAACPRSGCGGKLRMAQWGWLRYWYLLSSPDPLKTWPVSPVDGRMVG